jgi:hypothetical protein
VRSVASIEFRLSIEFIHRPKYRITVKVGTEGGGGCVQGGGGVHISNVRTGFSTGFPQERQWMSLVIFNALSVLAFFLSLAAFWLAVQSATHVQELRDRPESSQVSRIKSLETSLAETNDALAAVANRVKMMRVRSAANHTADRDDSPDPYKDPDRWRQSINKQIALGRLNNG